MPISIGQIQLEMPVVLAPLAGITDLPFRNLVMRFGAGLVVSEMVASREIVTARASARERAELGLNVENTSVQIAGHDPYWMSEAARLVEDRGAKIIDINMGCPAKKVTNGWAGAGLLRNLDHATKLIEAVVAAVSLPVTLKTRLGWDDLTPTAPELARRAQASGVQMVTVHGRTRCQFYKGSADWHAVSAVSASVNIPVLVNGDITDAASARRALIASKADGVMIGRGAQGRPWMLSHVAAELAGRPVPKAPTREAIIDIALGHYDEMLRFYGRELGLRVARKHLGWYMDALGVQRDLRSKVLTAVEPRVVHALLRLDDGARQAA